MSGVATRLHRGSDGTLTFERTQDCEPILERNKALQNDGDGYSPSRDLRRVASIPNVVIEKWLNEDGINLFDPAHADAVRRKLNDPEWRHLRTAPGQV